MRKTKIICTIGPACDSAQAITELITHGMNVARINMSHGDIESHQRTIDTIKNVREKINLPIAIMLDTKGPEIRIKTFKNNQVFLKKNRIFILTTQEIEGDETKVSLAYKNLIKEIKINQKIFANNGLIVLKVKQITDSEIVCKVLFGGKLTNGKGLNIPGIVPKGEYLSEKDKEDILFAIKNNVEFLACSFVSNSQNMKSVQNFISQHTNKKIKLIAKIENHDGIKNIKSILENCDGIMVARGDLGVEVALEKLPAFQKRAINISNLFGKISIVATEMLESMTNSIRPTRAEVSDVANAIYEKAGATMLSGETAIGKYPSHTVKTMEKIIVESEKNITYDKDFLNDRKRTNDTVDTFAHSICFNTISLNLKAIAIYGEKCDAIEYISRYRINTPIFVFTSNEKCFNALSLGWNVFPVLLEKSLNTNEIRAYIKSYLLDNKLVNSNDKILIQDENEFVLDGLDIINI